MALLHFFVGLLYFSFVYELFFDLLCCMIVSSTVEARMVLRTFATICSIGQICRTHGETLLGLVGSIFRLCITLVIFAFPFQSHDQFQDCSQVTEVRRWSGAKDELPRHLWVRLEGV